MTARTTRTPLAAAVAAVAALVAPARAAPAGAACPSLRIVQPGRFRPVTLEAGRPKFHIPADSPLARNEHPRFLLVGGDIDTLKRRAADPRLAPLLETIKRRCFGRFASNLERAVVYRITGEKRYLQAILDSPRLDEPTWCMPWPATIDLIWDDLPAERRRGLSDAAARSIAKGGSLYWRPTLQLASVFYEGGKGPHDAALRARMKRDFDETVLRWTDKLNAWAAGRGGSDMSHGYHGEHAYWEPFCAAICWAHATGEDYVGRAAFARYVSPFYWYHFVPGLEPLCVEKIGVTRQAHDSGAVAPQHSGANHLVFLTLAREGDGLGLAWMDKVRSQEPHWAKDREALGRLLWWGPGQRPIDPATLPTTRLFPTSGHVVMRSDWTPRATFATFRCGRFGEIDGSWGRNNADNLSFTVRKAGPLAIDSGCVHGQNVQVLKFHSNDAMLDYGRQTVAHNSITVGEGDFVHRDWHGRPVRDTVRRGGQSVRQDRTWWKKWGLAGPQRHFREGRIAAYRTHPLYDYALGDARFSYNPDDVTEATRQFVYLKGDAFVIYDRLVVTDPARRPCWMLHSLRQPAATGRERAMTPDEIGPQFVKLDGEKVPHPRPGGHVQMGGDGFYVESGSPGKKGGGWLEVQTLLPQGDQAERKRTGGKGHDFEVSGVQYGLADEGYKMADKPYAVLSTIGLLGWRVELRHRQPGRAVEFLHVLQVGTGPRAAANDAAVRSTPQAHHVSLDCGGRTFELTLRRTGRRGGSIKVTEPGAAAALCQADLPETVEDHWRHHRRDANFKAWVTDPRYRVVIEPTDADRAAAGE
jgi:hypothetical protein